MNRRDFFYDLPPALIAQRPLSDRASSRLMFLDRRTGAVGHGVFADLAAHIKPNDCLVLNDTKVIPARLFGVRDGGTARIEMLMHRPLDSGQWEVLVKPGRKCRPGDRLIFGDGRLVARIDDLAADGLRIVSLTHDGPLDRLLQDIGEMPLPHYIKTKLNGEAESSRYQTVYATNKGSVAAPTAGLHFTDALLAEIQAKGTRIARITLHVGLGTFRPVKVDDIKAHTMHSEFYHIDPAQAALINETKQTGGRVIAVGTTSCRTLESRADENGVIAPGSGWTDIFIYPGFCFRVIDGLITNFHLPESTLLMLVSAFCGRENTLNAYREAIQRAYRFFSFGDAMLII